MHIMPEWNEAKRYKVEGIHIPEDKAFVFELTKLEELPDFRKNDKWSFISWNQVYPMNRA